MKKLVLTIAIVLGMGIGAFAQNGGVFGYGDSRGGDAVDQSRDEGDGLISLPGSHGDENDTSAAPLGSGALLLIGFGAAYAMTKKREA